jgi:hypothetical protein
MRCVASVPVPVEVAYEVGQSLHRRRRFERSRKWAYVHDVFLEVALLFLRGGEAMGCSMSWTNSPPLESEELLEDGLRWAMVTSSSSLNSLLDDAIVVVFSK